jgi:hypothetical protein
VSYVQKRSQAKAFQRQIEATDGQIGALVYELYELTEEEIRIVEGHEPDEPYR